MTARSEITSYIKQSWTQTQVFLLDDLDSFNDLPVGNDIVLIISFPPAPEFLATLAAPNQRGWREEGIVQLMLAAPIGFDSASVEALAEPLRNMLRGRRIGQTVLESVDAFHASGGDDGKYRLWVSALTWYLDHFD